MRIGGISGEILGATLGVVIGPILAHTTSGVPVYAWIVHQVDSSFHLILKSKTADIICYFLGQNLAASLLDAFSALTAGYILKELFSF